MFFTLSQIVSHMSGNLYHKGFREADEIEIENMYSVFLSSYTNTRESLGELEKAVKHSPAARVTTAFLVLPNFHSCLSNSIETQYMFSIS